MSVNTYITANRAVLQDTAAWRHTTRGRTFFKKFCIQLSVTSLPKSINVKNFGAFKYSLKVLKVLEEERLQEMLLE